MYACMYMYCMYTYLLIIIIVHMYNTCITSSQLTDLNPFFFLLLFNLDKGDDDVRVSERHGNCEDLLSALNIRTLGKGREVDPRIHI